MDILDECRAHGVPNLYWVRPNVLRCGQPTAEGWDYLRTLLDGRRVTVLKQNEATDQWNYYQAHKIRANDTQLAGDLLSVVTISDKEKAKKIAEGYAGHQEKWAENLKEEQEKAEALEADVKHAEVRADHFDLAEALLEIGLVITSITLLTHRRIYWYLGLIFAAGGIAKVAPILFQMSFEFAHSLHGWQDFFQRIFS